MNLPNFLTLTRILLVPFFVTAVVYGHFSWAIVIFFCAAITDGLDGLIARIRHQKTNLGAILDPIADKLLLTSAFIVLGVQHLTPFWLTLVVVSRDVIISLGMLVVVLLGLSYEIKPRMVSKATTAIQIITVLAVLAAQLQLGVRPYLIIFYVITVVLTIASGLYYMYLGMKILNT